MIWNDFFFIFLHRKIYQVTYCLTIVGTFPGLFLYKHSDHAECLYGKTTIAEKDSYFIVDQTAYTKYMRC